LFVCIAVSDAAFATLRILAKLRQRLNVVHDPLTIHAQLRLCREARECQRSHTQNEAMIELPAIDFHIVQMNGT
jgi:hypothetical protein